jgi:hypothetical protein
MVVWIFCALHPRERILAYETWISSIPQQKSHSLALNFGMHQEFLP